MEKGINDLIKKAGLTPWALSKMMKEDKVPFSYSKNNWNNLRRGYTKPKDPYMYIYLASKLNKPVEDIIMCYSEHDPGNPLPPIGSYPDFDNEQEEMESW